MSRVHWTKYTDAGVVSVIRRKGKCLNVKCSDRQFKCLSEVGILVACLPDSRLTREVSAYLLEEALRDDK